MSPVVASSKQSIARGSKSFSAAARLLAPGMRESTSLLYAWCRHCDDVIDDQILGFASQTESSLSPQACLDHLYAQTREALAGNHCTEMPFQALQRVAARHDIPHKYPIELIDGMAMDVIARPYRTLEDLLDYCYHVAGVVGVMMAMVMGVKDRAALIRAADLGIAFQLTNISRDVIEDAANGRCYLPSRWLDEAGIPPGEVTLLRHRPAVARVVCRLLSIAEPYYGSARKGLRYLPFRAGWAIATAKGVYSDIGKRVLARGPQAWDSRISTGKSHKLYWTIAGLAIALQARSLDRLTSPGPRPDLWMKPDFSA
ncbi:MAG: phytoene/squalene synthase family protein [Rhodospirillaceae bacterium]|nr:phytoene/squalene synthase family protein [Rhodospirillaceae bacterium]